MPGEWTDIARSGLARRIQPVLSARPVSPLTTGGPYASLNSTLPWEDFPMRLREEDWL